MRKFALTSAVTVLFVIYIISGRRNADTASNIPPQTLADTSSASSSSPLLPSPANETDPRGAGFAETNPAKEDSGETEDNAPAKAAPAPKPAPAAPAQAKTTPVAQTRQTPPPAPKPAGQYKDGGYLGPVTDAYFGNVQVKAIISGGKLANVEFLDYPQDRGTSRYINSQAMPTLIQEAIAAQSANVDIVSGATQTSTAFQQSLAAALLQAKN